jgi:hypothetical protein
MARPIITNVNKRIKGLRSDDCLRTPNLSLKLPSTIQMKGKNNIKKDIADLERVILNANNKILYK